MQVPLLQNKNFNGPRFQHKGFQPMLRVSNLENCAVGVVGVRMDQQGVTNTPQVVKL